MSCGNLHQPPNVREKYLYCNTNRKLFYALSVVSTAFLFVGNFIFVSAFPQIIPLTIALLITVFYLTLSFMVGFLGRDFDLEKHTTLVAKWFNKSLDASVDIYLPICNEDLTVVRNTWVHVRELIKKHPRAMVFVLDDGKSDACLEMAKEFGFYYIRRETNELKKAGNLRNAFRITVGDFIVIFDADFCPRPDFLTETLPYFFEHETVGIVQTPQFFDTKKDYGWIRNGAGAVQELFYRLIQINRNTFNGAICVGTNAVYRRKHLDPFGGTAPMAYSEDVHTGFQIIQNGQQIVYIPLNLAKGECPSALKQFFTQQYRWAMGSISLFFNPKFWKTKLRPMQRISYLTGMLYYISTGIASVTYFIPSLFILIFHPDKIFWFNLIFSIPSFLFTVLYMRFWMKLPMNLDVLKSRQISYFAHLYALKDYLFNTLEEWKPTGVKSNSQRYKDFTFIYTVISLCIPTLLFSLITLRISQGHDYRDFLLLIFFVVFNCAITIPIIKNDLGD